MRLPEFFFALRRRERPGHAREEVESASRVDLQAERWSLIERIAFERTDAATLSTEVWSQHDDASKPVGINWGFVLDAVEADRRLRAGSAEDLNAGAGLFRKVVSDLKQRRREAQNSPEGQDRDGNDIDFTGLALALALTRLARLVIRDGEGGAEEAARILKEAVEVAPRELYVREEKVSILLALGHFSDAEQEARRAASIFSSPDDTTRAATLLGAVFLRRAGQEADKSRYDDAAKHLKTAKQILPGPFHSQVAEEQGVLLMRQGRDQEARGRFLQSVRPLEVAPRPDNQPDQIEDFGRALDWLVLMSLLSSGWEGFRRLGSRLQLGSLTGRLPAVASLLRRLPDRTDLGPRLRMLLAEARVQEIEYGVRREIGRALLELFDQSTLLSAPFASIVTEVAVVFDPVKHVCREAQLAARVEAARRRLIDAYGVELPPVRLRTERSDDSALGPLLLIRESDVIPVDVRPERDLYVGPACIFRAAGLPRIRAPAGLAGEAAWAPPADRERLEALGLRRLTVLDLILLHLESAIEANLPRLVTWEAVRRLVERYRLSKDGELSAEEMSAVVCVVRERLRERVPVLDFETLYRAALADRAGGRSPQDKDSIAKPVATRRKGKVQAASVESLRERLSSAFAELDADPQRTPAPRAAFGPKGEIASVDLALMVELRGGGELDDPTKARGFARHLGARAEGFLSALGVQARCRVRVAGVANLPNGVPYRIWIEEQECRIQRQRDVGVPQNIAGTTERVFADLFRNRDLFATDPVVSSAGGDRAIVLTAFRHGVAIDRLRARWPAFKAALPNEARESHALELLISELAAPELPVRLGDDRFAALTAMSSKAASDQKDSFLENIRRQLFWKLGFWTPPLVLRRDPGLAPDEMALGLNDAPMPVRKPFGDETKDLVGQLETAILAEALPVAPALLTLGVVERMLADLSDRTFFPGFLVDVLESLDILTFLSVLRGLVEERCAIRDQRLIMETILSQVLPRGDNRGVRPPSIEDLLQAVRIALAPQIAAQYRRRQSLAVVRVDGALEQRLAASPIEAAEKQGLLAQLQAIYFNQSTPDSPPALIVDKSARLATRRLIAVEFPDAPVLARQELPPSVTEQPLATLAL